MAPVQRSTRGACPADRRIACTAAKRPPGWELKRQAHLDRNVKLSPPLLVHLVWRRRELPQGHRKALVQRERHLHYACALLLPSTCPGHQTAGTQACRKPNRGGPHLGDDVRQVRVVGGAHIHAPSVRRALVVRLHAPGVSSASRRAHCAAWQRAVLPARDCISGLEAAGAAAPWCRGSQRCCRCRWARRGTPA